MRRGAPEELCSQPVGHRRRLSPGRDGAVAHRPQAGVLAESGKPRQSGNQSRGHEHPDLRLITALDGVLHTGRSLYC